MHGEISIHYTSSKQSFLWEVYRNHHIHPSLCPSVHIYPSLRPSVHIHPSLHPSVHIHPSLRPPVHIYPSLRPSVHIYPSLHPSVHIPPKWMNRYWSNLAHFLYTTWWCARRKVIHVRKISREIIEGRELFVWDGGIFWDLTHSCR